jgi:hypothetical protein
MKRSTRTRVAGGGSRTGAAAPDVRAVERFIARSLGVVAPERVDARAVSIPRSKVGDGMDFVAVRFFSPTRCGRPADRWRMAEVVSDQILDGWPSARVLGCRIEPEAVEVEVEFPGPGDDERR